LTPSKTDGSGQTREELDLKNKKQKRAQKHKEEKKVSKTDEEDSEDTFGLYCFGASVEMCIHCTDCKLRSDEECTDGSPNCVCLKLSI
jgi:hypothetical protein